MMWDMINKLLDNQIVLLGVAAVLGALLHRIAEWLEGKTKGGIVEEWWPYIHHALGESIEWVEGQAKSGELTGSDADKAIAKVLAGFREQYRLYEGKEPSKHLVGIVRGEALETFARLVKNGIVVDDDN